VHPIDLPAASARDAADRAFAEARAATTGLRGSSENIAYRLMSRGALPTDARELVDRVRIGEAAAIDDAIAWLTFDPFCLWSGYTKQRLMRALAQQTLSARQAAAAQRFLLDIIPRGRRTEFRDACRLARSVNTHAFRQRLAALVERGDADSRQRAQWMLEGCERTAGA
jgi:hypothetical protein